MVTTCSSSSTNGAPAGSGAPIAHSLPAWPRSRRDKCIGALADQFGIGELDHLPGAVGALHRRRIGAGEQRAVGHRGQRAAVKLHAKLALCQRAVGPAGRSSSVSPTIVGASAKPDAAVAQAVARRPHRHRPRPGIGEHRQPRQHRRLLGGQRRQIEHQRMHRADRRRRRRRAAARRRQRQIEHFRIDRARPHGAAFGVGDFLDFDQPPPSVDGQADHVAGRQRKPARRQRETRRSRGRPTDPAARFRRAARPRCRWSPSRDRHARVRVEPPTSRREVAAAR